MPMMMYWHTYKRYDGSRYWIYEYQYYFDMPRFRGITTNASSVYESSLTYTATGQTVGDSYQCRVSFSSPTGLVLRGVQKQYSNSIDSFRSSLFLSKTVASENNINSLHE